MTIWQEQIKNAQTNIQEWYCEGCGKKETMTGQEAYNNGWDVPPWFSGHIKCNNCDITKTANYILLNGLGNE